MTKPALPVAELMVVSEECARLIGSINAGVELVNQMGTGDKDPFESSATALEAVATTLSSSSFRTPDLQRMGGFYVGVIKTQAGLIREIGAALESGDEAKAKAAQAKLEQVGKMEDTVVEEVNVRCRGTSADGPPGAASAPVPTSAPQP